MKLGRKERWEWEVESKHNSFYKFMILGKSSDRLSILKWLPLITYTQRNTLNMLCVCVLAHTCMRKDGKIKCCCRRKPPRTGLYKGGRRIGMPFSL